MGGVTASAAVEKQDFVKEWQQIFAMGGKEYKRYREEVGQSRKSAKIVRAGLEVEGL